MIYFHSYTTIYITINNQIVKSI